VNSIKIKIALVCDTIAFISLCAIAFFLPISKAIIESFSIVAIVAYITRKLLSRENVPETALNYGILAYAVVCVVSIFFSSNSILSARTFFLKTLQGILLFFTIAETLPSGKRVKILLSILFTSSFVLGIDGIYQYFTRVDFIRHRPRIFEDRIYASFVTPNSFGCYIAMVLPFTLTHFFMKIRLIIIYLSSFNHVPRSMVCLFAFGDIYCHLDTSAQRVSSCYRHTCNSTAAFLSAIFKGTVEKFLYLH